VGRYKIAILIVIVAFTPVVSMVLGVVFHIISMMNVWGWLMVLAFVAGAVRNRLSR
jgi:hypothetical protein